MSEASISLILELMQVPNNFFTSFTVHFPLPYMHKVVRMEGLSMETQPYYCTDAIRQCIKKGLTESPQSFGIQAVARAIDIPITQLLIQYADMARVRNTPQPECFRVMLHMFTIIYLLLLPVISYKAMGYWVIPEGESRAGSKGGRGEGSDRLNNCKAVLRMHPTIYSCIQQW